MRTQCLEPRRLRFPRGAYGWVDLRVVTTGYLERVGTGAALTYLFLCAVGNTQGVSFWSRPKMARTLGLALEDVDIAIRTLQEVDLIATDGRVIQVLPIETSAQKDGPPNGRTSIATSVSSGAPRSVVAATDGPRVVAEVDDAEIRPFEREARQQLAKISPRVCSEAVRRVAKALALEARGNHRG